MRCEIPHRCVRRKYRIRRHSPFRLRNCWEGRSVRASSLLRQLAKGGCAARRLSWVTPGFSQSRRCKTTASEFELGTANSADIGSSSPKHFMSPSQMFGGNCGQKRELTSQNRTSNYLRKFLSIHPWRISSSSNPHNF